MTSVSLKCSDIATAIGAELLGDGDTVITSIAAVDNAKEGSITFITGRKYLDALRATHASAVILPKDFSTETSATQLVMDNPYLGYAKLTQLWVAHSSAQLTVPVHHSASVSEDATLEADVTVGANAVIESGATIGRGSVIGAGSYIGRSVSIGAGTVVHSNATIMHSCTVGRNCEIHSSAVIGSDGFGFAPSEGGWEKIHQLGSVVIGDRVNIGAGTTVDRGALEDTVIGDGVILDNLIQVAHNVTIGVNTAIAGCTGIAGSTTIGANCRIGGAVCITGHINICDDVTVTGTSFVNRSVDEPGSYSSGFPLQTSKQWRKNAVRLQRLDELSRQVVKLKS